MTQNSKYAAARHIGARLPTFKNLLTNCRPLLDFGQVASRCCLPRNVLILVMEIPPQSAQFLA
jgi:hypothetical protein